MISREEKNQVYIDEINREKTKKVIKCFLKIFGILLMIFTLIFLYAYFIEITFFKTNEIVLKDSNIPSGFVGKKILHISDILYGKTIKAKEINTLKEEIKLINPDIIFFTGNIISKDYSLSENDINELKNFFIEMPCTIGKYAIKGDTDTTSFDLILDNTNFTIIDNEKLELFTEKNEKLNLIGLNYNEESKKEIKADNCYTIVLINNYDEFGKNHINANLVLAGHNLGGEMKLFNIPLLNNDKHLNNYYEENETRVYISNGLGSIHHLRLMNRPSMNVYRLYNE